MKLYHVFVYTFWGYNFEQVPEKTRSKMEIQPRETKLEARVGKFISLICIVNMMKQQMMEIGLFLVSLHLVVKKSTRFS